jgi:hypothetical protein
VDTILKIPVECKIKLNGSLWTAKIVFEVDGRQTRIVRLVREAYGDYAN